MRYILGLESTCDDSGLGIFDKKENKIIWNKIYSQNTQHKKFGGVVPEIASREHFKAIPNLLEEIFNSKEIKISLEEIELLAVSSRPGLMGSLLVGNSYMQSLAWSWGKKILTVDHLEAHILSPLIEHTNLTFPYLCFLLSGGHTLAVIVEKIGSYHVLGTTEDDALGESFDKVAKLLGFEYPGGPIIEKLYECWEEQQKKEQLLPLPIPLKKRLDYNFSYSGLKTATKRLALQLGLKEKKNLISLKEFFQKNDKNKDKIILLAASFQKIAYLSLLWNYKKISKKYFFKNFAIVGGVANNIFIRKNFQSFCSKQGVNFFYPSAKYCTDNGAMIAYTAYCYLKNKNFPQINITSKSPLALISNVK